MRYTTGAVLVFLTCLFIGACKGSGTSGTTDVTDEVSDTGITSPDVTEQGSVGLSEGEKCQYTGQCVEPLRCCASTQVCTNTGGGPCPVLEDVYDVEDVDVNHDITAFDVSSECPADADEFEEGPSVLDAQDESGMPESDQDATHPDPGFELPWDAAFESGGKDEGHESGGEDAFEAGDSCVPNCGTAECGDDGCGGDCGTCATERPHCDTGRCVQCLTVDDCGQSQTCMQGVCTTEECLVVCQDSGVQCGPVLTCDCGLCPQGMNCDTGECVTDCVAACEGRECGTTLGCICPPGCGTAKPDCLAEGVCVECLADGECKDGKTCINYECTCVAKTCADQGIECGPSDDGCGNALDCKSCLAGSHCSTDGKCLPDPVCGNGTCEEGEGTSSCCLDCGCAPGSLCYQGNCAPVVAYESRLRDTGIEWCLGGAGSDCPALDTTSSGQDGTYRDAFPEPQYQGSPWSNTVFVDEITGLTWLVSMNPNKAVTWSQASTGCQDLSYAGFNDWRLPSAREFNTIVDYRTGRVFEALFGEDNAGSIEVAWTASACGDQASAFDPTGGNQTLGHSAITYKYLYRCVRGEWKGTTVASSSTAVDNRTDLEWTATPQAPGMDWVTALAYCESLVLDGKDDWRLPNIREVMDAGYAGILQQPSAVSNGYWSSSPMPSGVSVWVARRDKCFPETYSESPGETTRQGTVCVRSTCGFSCGDNRCRSGFCTCAEECAGKPCGDAACGPACGQCRAGFFCQDGACPKAGRYVLVGHGAFSMGSATNEVCRDLDEPQHAVTITRDLLVKETVVTQGEWKAVFGNNPSSASNCGDDCPVERVNWFEAVAYCNELSKKAGLQECYSLTNCDGTPGNVMTCSPDVVFAGLECTGFRLPTESEWEYFARAGSVTTYPNGGSSVATDLSDCGGCLNETGLNAIAWYCHNAGDKVHPVAKKTPNDWGVFDCLGNVQQWCSDWMGDYPGSATDPTGPAGGTNRVIRGGAYFDDVRNRSASRFSTSPSDALFHVGFRPVRTW